MDSISPTNDENIIDVLCCIFPVIDICEIIVNFKNASEKEDTLKYHVEAWERIAGAYLRSIENRYPTYSYIGWNESFSGPSFIARPDKIRYFYDITGCPYQVRDTLLKQIEEFNTIDEEEFSNDKVWFYEDDKKLSILSDKILQKMKCGK